MAKVQIGNVIVLDNPSSFLNAFQFELTFECIEELKEDLEWKMIYVGSAESEEHDQLAEPLKSTDFTRKVVQAPAPVWGVPLRSMDNNVGRHRPYRDYTVWSANCLLREVLDTIYVGPISEGRHMFVFQADPPDVSKIPPEDALGVTVILLTCSYRGQEFVRVGYFINNEYSDPELRENPPTIPQFDKVMRNILGSEPRVTRFKINWDDSDGAEEGTSEGPTVESTTANIDLSNFGHSTTSNGSASGMQQAPPMEVA